MASISSMRGKPGEGGRLADPKWQLEPCCQLQEHSRQDLTSAEFPSFQRRRARGRKREAQRHTQQHHSWELGLCNKGPVSGWELRAIKTAATDLGETAGIYPRNLDYVATAEAEQKVPRPWKAKRWQVMGNQLHYPTVPASPTQSLHFSHRAWGRGLLLLVLPPDSPTKGRVRTPALSPHVDLAAAGRGSRGSLLQGCLGDTGQAKQSVVPKTRALLQV